MFNKEELEYLKAILNNRLASFKKEFELCVNKNRNDELIKTMNLIEDMIGTIEINLSVLEEEEIKEVDDFLG